MNPDDLARAADFGTRFIPLALKLRLARDIRSGIELSADEVATLIEVLQVLREGP